MSSTSISDNLGKYQIDYEDGPRLSNVHTEYDR